MPYSEIIAVCSQIQTKHKNILCGQNVALLNITLAIHKTTWLRRIHIFSKIRVMKTNLMHYLSSVYFINQPLHVSGIFVAHHQEVYCLYTTIGTCCAF